ncbi:DUF6220 domain-containing protein [Bacillus sp. FJAT-49736]|uniref:DUF6220 domain-containing protein n=1 Tax=Bacillus sp. FJAT-49736 TaxID=2833582 RepID=UPI001BC99EB2|nr:DUF6220 domain-containing protein [Bacillus sp. FJAT-49736]MBS4173038.1 hypothetical protein [Bacillus sp. FJAT-49736]
MDHQVPGKNTFRMIYMILSILFFISILVQVFFAGIAIFVHIGDWSYHQSFVHLFEFIPVIMFIISLFGGIPKLWKWDSASLFLMIVLQYVTASLIGKVPFVSALHPIIALVLFWRALVMSQAAIGLIKNKRSR